MLTRRTAMAVAAAISATLVLASAVVAWSTGPWSPAMNAETIPGTSGDLNTAALEGCAFIAQRDDVLYFASNRPGGAGGLDIWYAERLATGGWGDPVNFRAVNTAADELCPTAHRNGKTFLFVSNRPGGCGGDDIYVTRWHATRGWADPRNLGCVVNSAANEAAPSLVEHELYFSSTRPGGESPEAPGSASGDADIYVSRLDGDGFGEPVLAAGLSSAANDFRPNLRRDGLEIFFDSTRPGGFGGLDLYTATRANTSSPWTDVVNLGANVNSAAADLRATLSWDGGTLYFNSNRSGGQQDIYVVTR